MKVRKFMLLCCSDFCIRRCFKKCNDTTLLKLSDAVVSTWSVHEEAGNLEFLESGEIRCV